MERGSFVARIRRSVLFKNTFVYTLLQLLNRGIPFALLPVLTHYLSPEEYGRIATYTTWVGFLSIFVGLNVSGAVSVSFFRMDREALRRYIGNVFVVLAASTVTVTAIVALFEPVIAQKLNLPVFWIYVAVAAVAMQTITGVNLVLWRSQQRAGPYALYEISQSLLNIVLSLFLVVVLREGWEGRVTGSAFASVLFGALSVVFIYKRGYATLKIATTYVVDILKFGVTLIPHQLALWVRSGVDILLINTLVGASATGLYNVGFQFGMIVGIFAAAFNNAFSPYLYEKLKRLTPSMAENLVRFTYLYFVAILLFSLGTATLFVWLVPYLLGEKFHAVGAYIYWISVAFAFQGMYLMVVNYIFYAKKNHWVSMVTFPVSLLHLLLSFLLIRLYGAIGAAYASVVSYFLMFVLVWRVSARLVPMPWKAVFRRGDAKR